MTRSGVEARIRRRELHSPRTVAAVVTAIVVAALLAWVGTELVLRLLDQPPLLATPAQMYGFVRDLPALEPAVLATAGIVIVIVGLVPLLLAILPGRRGRHTLPSARAVVVVDDEVIASSLARVAARTGRVDPDNASVSVSRRRAQVRLTPASGTAIDVDAVQRQVDDQLTAIGAEPALAGRIRVATTGTVGA